MQLREIVTIEPVNQYGDIVSYIGSNYEVYIGIDGKWSKVGNLEAISWNEDLKDNIITGSMVLSTYDKDGILYAGIDPKIPFNLILVATTKYGDVSSQALWNVKLKTISRGVSINDLSNSVGCTFDAEECSPLMPYSLEKTFEIYMNKARG